MLPTPQKRRVIQTCAIVLLWVLTTTVPSPSANPARSNSSATAWSWPVDAPHPVVRDFIAPATAYSAGHRGIDIDARSGAIVRAPASGIVHFSGFVVNRNLLSIDHGGGIISSYEPVLAELTEGTQVHRGQEIGVLQSGHCRTPCLHLGVRSYGQYVSPLKFLGGISPSVLLPTRQLH